MRDHFGFFERLVPLTSFVEVCDSTRYAHAPDSHVVVITDVRRSTDAVAAGHYKEVNVLGAASIITALNAVKGPKPPFCFGGDGALLLLSQTQFESAAAALNGLAWLAKEVFALDLRVGAVPVSALTARGYDVLVAKFAVSSDVELAMFAGEGIDEATHLVKGPQTERSYSLVSEERPKVRPSFINGLQCRWKPIRSRHGRIVSLIVKATVGTFSQCSDIYRDTIEFMHAVADERAMQPISEEGAQLADDVMDLDTESRIRTGRSRGLRYRLYRRKAHMVTTVAKGLIKRERKLGGFDGATYKRAVVANSDFRKFDGCLRMVVDLTDSQCEQLDAYLDERFVAGDLVYGVHCSDSALMTCIVRDLHDHVHFIDGADGGYTYAARQMDRRESETAEAQALNVSLAG